MEPNKWGPHLWFFLHTISFNYPDNPSFITRKQYNEFYNSLRNMLPCESCKKHYDDNLSQMPPNLNSKVDLIKWTIDLHNKVNKITNKKQYSYKEAMELYNKYYKNLDTMKGLFDYDYSEKPDTTGLLMKYGQILALVSILSIMLYLLFKNKKNARKVIRY